jgi:hypothetical protein
MDAVPRVTRAPLLPVLTLFVEDGFSIKGSLLRELSSGGIFAD